MYGIYSSKAKSRNVDESEKLFVYPLCDSDPLENLSSSSAHAAPFH